MDRFIEEAFANAVKGGIDFKIQYGQIYRILIAPFALQKPTLKSNMDRFIVQCGEYFPLLIPSLKSNMDRFIDALTL